MLVGKNYDRMKWLVALWLPAAASAYFVFGNLLDFPSVEKVVGILAIVVTFFGVILKVSSDKGNSEYDGSLIVTESEDGATWRIELNDTPEELERKDTITFKKITDDV